MHKTIIPVLCTILSVSTFNGTGQTLPFPPREDHFITGSRFAEAIREMEPEERENTIIGQFTKGNVPYFLRKTVPITVTGTIRGIDYLLTYHVLPDYLAVGTDEDYLLIPMTPGSAQVIADFYDCSLPTTKMVDDIYRIAMLKLPPSPLPPGDSITTVPVFLRHSQLIQSQRDSLLKVFPQGTLTAGHKKDVVLTDELFGTNQYEKVAIYGWHKPDGNPIQPLYTGHSNRWVDYSHGIRLIRKKVVLNGKTMQLSEILQDPQLSQLVSNEGPIRIIKYPVPERNVEGE